MTKHRAVKLQLLAVDRIPSEDTPIRAFALLDFCTRYGISRSTAFREMRAGRLTARKLGKKLLIREEDAEAWLAAIPVKPNGGEAA